MFYSRLLCHTHSYQLVSLFASGRKIFVFDFNKKLFPNYEGMLMNERERSLLIIAFD